MGIPVKRVVSIVWAISAAVATCAGVLLAPINTLVAELNERARADRLASAPARVGRTVTLSDGLQASVGDWLATRSNARWLRSGPCPGRPGP